MVFTKPFEVPQRSVKIKTSGVNFLSLSRIRTGRVNVQYDKVSSLRNPMLNLLLGSVYFQLI